MAFFFKNKCQYKNCGQEFKSLADLIQHVEQCHVFLDDDDIGTSEMVPLSRILPNNIHDVAMGLTDSRPNAAPQTNTTFANQNNPISPMMFPISDPLISGIPPTQAMTIDTFDNERIESLSPILAYNIDNVDMATSFHVSSLNFIPQTNTMSVYDNTPIPHFDSQFVNSNLSAMPPIELIATENYDNEQVTSLNQMGPINNNNDVELAMPPIEAIDINNYDNQHVASLNQVVPNKNMEDASAMPPIEMIDMKSCGNKQAISLNQVGQKSTNNVGIDFFSNNHELQTETKPVNYSNYTSLSESTFVPRPTVSDLVNKINLTRPSFTSTEFSYFMKELLTDTESILTSDQNVEISDNQNSFAEAVVTKETATSKSVNQHNPLNDPNKLNNIVENKTAIQLASNHAKDFNYFMNELLTETVSVPTSDRNVVLPGNQNSFLQVGSTEKSTPSKSVNQHNGLFDTGKLKNLEDYKNALKLPTSQPINLFNDNTHIYESGLTADEIVKLALELANPKEAKPYACPLAGCNKRYKSINGLKYHADAPRREANKSKKAKKSIKPPTQREEQPSPSYDNTEEDIDVVNCD